MMPKKNFLWLILASVIALLAGWYTFSLSQKSSISLTVPNISLPSIDGETLAIPNTEKQLTWVHFWSVSCAPCIEELPHLEAYYRQSIKAHQEVDLVTIAMPYDPPNIVLETRDHMQLSLPITLDLQGLAVQVFSRNMVTPAHFLVDKTGRVVFKHFGTIEIKDLEKIIEQALSV